MWLTGPRAVKTVKHDVLEIASPGGTHNSIPLFLREFLQVVSNLRATSFLRAS